MTDASNPSTMGGSYGQEAYKFEPTQQFSETLAQNKEHKVLGRS